MSALSPLNRPPLQRALLLLLLITNGCNLLLCPPSSRSLLHWHSSQEPFFFFPSSFSTIRLCYPTFRILLSIPSSLSSAIQHFPFCNSAELDLSHLLTPLLLRHCFSPTNVFLFFFASCVRPSLQRSTVYSRHPANDWRTVANANHLLYSTTPFLLLLLILDILVNTIFSHPPTTPFSEPVVQQPLIDA